MPTQDAYRLLALLLGVIGLILWSLYARKSKRWGYAAPVLLWLGNCTAFWIWTTFIRPPGMMLEQANAWSAIVQLQALITLALAGLLLWLDDR